MDLKLPLFRSLIRIFAPVFMLGVASTGSCVTEALIEPDSPTESLSALEAEQAEFERREMFLIWEELCHRGGGYVLANQPQTCRVGEKNCIPHRSEWNYELKERKSGTEIVSKSVTYKCVSRRW